MHRGKKVSCGLVVAGRKGAKLLEFGEEVLDQVSRFVEVLVVVARRPAARLGWNHGGFAGSGKRRDDPRLGVKSLVSDQNISLHHRQQMVGPNQIVDLSAGQQNANRIAMRISQSVDLGAQPAAGSSDCLILADFFFAPALC